MNKLLKGAIAGTAGIALLLGGAGTFALWNSTANVDGGTIVAGNLAVVPSTTVGTWTVNGTAIDIADYRIVPGDVLVYTKAMSITATGDNLEATLSIDAASVSATSTSDDADVALAAYVTESAALTATGPGITGGPDSYTVTAGEAGVSQDVSVAVTISFPNTADLQNDAMLGSVNLDALAVTLTQI